jgi:hypothetical protein
MSPLDGLPPLRPHADHVAPLITPQRHARSSREAGSFTEVPLPWRDAHSEWREQAGNKQLWNSTALNDRLGPRIHARSGQPLAVMLNGTVRGLTYKQEAGGSSPSPPIIKRPAKQPLRVSYSVGVATPNRCREQATRHSASTHAVSIVGGAVGRARAVPGTARRCLWPSRRRAGSLSVSPGAAVIHPRRARTSVGGRAPHHEPLSRPDG